jgi:hypothetical protein
MIDSTILIQEIGTAFTALCAAGAAYFGFRNHTLATKIDVNTNGNLARLMGDLEKARNEMVEERDHSRKLAEDAIKAAALVATAAAAAAAASAKKTEVLPTPP